MFQAPGSMKAPLSRFKYALAAVVFAGYAILTLAGPKGPSAWREKERQIQVLEKRNAELQRVGGRPERALGSRPARR